MSTAAGPAGLVAAAAVTDTLERCRTLVTPALRAAVERLAPDVGAMAAYTFGWQDVDGTPRAGAAGKGLRPAFALLAAEAVGAPAEAAVPGAVAVELVHAFSLVHDDIMDGDERRRHRDTVWKAYGVGPAVLAGDALLVLAVDTLAAAAPEPARTAAMDLLTTALVELVNGQAADVAFETRPWTGPGAVSVEEYTAMAVGKTGSLLGCAAGLGALLGGAPPDTVAALDRTGRDVGLAFQAVDDLLGVWGDPALTGKPVRNDLRERKKTLPVVAALASGTPAGERLPRLLGDDASLHEAARAIETAGGRALTSALAERHLRRARRALDRVATDHAAAEALGALAAFAVTRTH
ncbi:MULTISPECIES: polyprenyl synthetase family protein [unclassified Streptomyces]|uniref:polyprenyl synthetase family protein n=1 Tax=unclassified Streptomyces TaxID=2593676 RepID=UPI0033D99DE2